MSDILAQIEDLNNSKKDLESQIEKIKIKFFNKELKKGIKKYTKEHKNIDYVQVLKEWKIKMTNYKFNRTISVDPSNENIANDEDIKVDANDENYFYDISYSFYIEDIKIKVECNSIISKNTNTYNFTFYDNLCHYINGTKVKHKEIIDGWNTDSNMHKFIKTSLLRKKYKLTIDEFHEIICYVFAIFENCIFKFETGSKLHY